MNYLTCIFHFIINYLYIIINILSLFITISFIFFYLDGYKLSIIYYIILMQKLSFYSLILLLIVTISQINLIHELGMIEPIYINEKESDGVNLHGYVNVTKDAAAELSKGMNAVGSNIGLGGTMIGVGTAIGIAITKSGMPPLQKASVILGGSVLGGIAHSAISKNSRNEALSSLTENQTNSVNEISKNVDKFLDDSSYAPLEGMLSDIQSASITCLGLMIILIIQLIFKLHTKDSITLKLSYFLGTNLNKKMENYINKIIILNKKMSTIYI